MLRDKKTLLISLILGLAAAGIFLAYTNNWLKKPAAEELEGTADSAMKKCVVAAADIGIRSPLTEDMLTEISVPSDMAHPLCVESKESVVGRIARDRLVKGQYILQPNISDIKTSSELSFVLAEGMRAITISASVTTAVGNMLRPGDYVDVMVFFDDQTAGEGVSFNLLPKTLVLATDTMIEQEEPSEGPLGKVGSATQNIKGYQSVTLAASPDDCAKLIYAESVGRLKLALHSPRETGTKTDMKHVVFDDIAKEAGFKAKKANADAKYAGKTSPETSVVAKKAEPKEIISQSSATSDSRTIQITRGVESTVVNVSDASSYKYAAKRGGQQ
jgi:pilus assembly protein CpaB